MISDSVIEMVFCQWLNGSMSSKSVNERAAGCLKKHQLGAIFRRVTGAA